MRMNLPAFPVAAAALLSVLPLCASSQNASTYHNPVLPGFHPDPTCIFVPELDNTFFCTFSSFLTFPGLPVYASCDLVHWRLVSNALSRPDQLPALAFLPRGATGGIYAPTLRYRNGTFYIVTTLANQALYGNNYTRWDNFILTSRDPYNSASWSDPVHFDFPGIDPSPFWDDAGDGKVHLTGSVDGKSILQAPFDLDTGEILAPLTIIWNGTGLPSPEAPHTYYKDGWYYLVTAEGGTRERHRVNAARSRSLYGPYEGDPANPPLSGYLSPSYFQAVGHVDIFRDAGAQYWAIALGVRAGPSYNQDPYNSVFPMGREALLTPVAWPEGQWPAFQNITGTMIGAFRLPSSPNCTAALGAREPALGAAPDADDSVDFALGSILPSHHFYWRLPVTKNYAISPAGHPNSLRLTSSKLNLTAWDGDSTRGWGQTFVARRQAHSRFRFRVDVDYSGLSKAGHEVGVTALQDQAQHFDIAVVMLPLNGSEGREGGRAVPHIRFRGISTTTYRLPERFRYVDNATPLLEGWVGKRVRLQVEAVNTTHYAFSAGPGGDEVGDEADMNVFGWARGNHLVPYYSGVVVGVYATSNGRYGEGSFDAYVSRWRYEGLGQVREIPGNQGAVVWDY